MIRTDEDFFNAADKAAPFEKEDAKHLRAVLSSEPFIRAARNVLDQTDILKNRLLAFNFGDPKDQAEAAKIQGKIIAYPEVFGLLVDLALRDLPLEEIRDEKVLVPTSASSA